ncbi:MAG: hypothetical protein U1E28_02255 [Beijerinckiaceae bacterium]
MAKASVPAPAATGRGRARAAVDALLFLAAILTVAGVAFSTRPAATANVTIVSSELKAR